MDPAFPENRLDGQWMWPSQADLLVVDERWFLVQGLKPDTGGGASLRSWISRMHPEDAIAFESVLSGLLAGKTVTDALEVRCRDGNGQWAWLFCRVRASPGENGAQPSLAGVVQDITTRKRQEAILLDDRSPIDSSELVASVGHWQVDLLQERIVWSDDTCRMHGRRPGHEPTYDEAFEHFTPSARPAIRTCFEQTIENGADFDIELPLNRADGKRILVRCIGSAEFADGVPIRVGGVMQDVTDTAERQLEQVRDSHYELERVIERLSLASSSGGIGIWDLDVATGEFVWDEQMFDLYGLEHVGDGLIGAERWLEFTFEGDRQRILKAGRDLIVNDSPKEMEFRIVRADGEERQMQGSARVVRDSNGWALRLVGTNQDVTQARLLAQELARQHEILAVTLRSIGDGVITTDTSGKVIWLNPAAELMVGWKTIAARGRDLGDVFRILDGVTRKPVPDPVCACLDEDPVVRLKQHRLLISKNGEESWVEDSVAPIRDDEGTIYGTVLVFHDVTEQRSIASELTWRATHDELTHLVNRSEFESVLKRLHERGPDCGDVHALLFIDLDQFKVVNDSCGHAAGDQLLRQVSRKLERAVRVGDTVARLGGDEFAVILERCQAESAWTIAQQFCDDMDRYRFTYAGQRFRIGASIGLVAFDSRWLDASTIVRAADMACYAAKQAGRNRVHRWCDTDRATRLHQVHTTWATRLANALDDDGFELYAQRIESLDSIPEAGPFVSGCSSGNRSEFAHAEILLRLKDGGGALILPAAFLPAAERFNLINRIDRWVLTRVIAWLERHRENIDIGRLWINLSGQSFEDRKFQHETLVRLRTAGEAVCNALCFEITETVAVTSLGDAAGFIEALRGLGVHVALDDFGAGAASFGYLKTLPVDFLKIDGQFVRNMTEDPLDDAAVRCFAEVARLLGIESVAEHVENQEVLNRLRDIGLDHVQGWLLHKPVPIDVLRDRTVLETVTGAG